MPSDNLTSRWPIQRRWSVTSRSGTIRYLGTSELLEIRACSLLGTAGLGKSFEMSLLARLDIQRGCDVRQERMALLGHTSDGVSARLHVISASATKNTCIYLDGLDELMVPVKVAGPILDRWIREELKVLKPGIRISCRSAVWLPIVEGAIRDVYGDDNVVTALLQPLSQEDVKIAAERFGLNATAFWDAVEAARATVLAEQPLTLNFLMRIFAKSGTLPSSRKELFADGISSLATENIERVENGTAIEVTPADILSGAEQLACYCILSGEDFIDLGTTSSSALGRHSLSRLPHDGRQFDDQFLRAIGSSGICESESSRTFRFAHRQIAEYLAGRRLARLLPHQARSLLSSETGWRYGVAGPLRETAAFCAIESPKIAEWITRFDPEIIGLSDITDDVLRRQATLNLIDRFRRHELTDSQITRHGMELSGLRYSNAEADLTPVLRDRSSGCEDVIAFAIGLITQWKLSSLSDILADLALDASAPFQSRMDACYALWDVGTKESRNRLKSLIYSGGTGFDLDLKGIAIRCNWPDNLTIQELFDGLDSNPNDRHFGAYDLILHELNEADFAATGDLLAGLTWAQRMIHNSSDFDQVTQIIRRIAIASLADYDVPEIMNALADLILQAAQIHVNSPLTPPRNRLLEKQDDDATPSLLSYCSEARRKLIEALITRSDVNSNVWWTVYYTPDLLSINDFPWLLEKAASQDIPSSCRTGYAHMARMLPWTEQSVYVDMWLAYRDLEPINSILDYPLTSELGSKAARELKSNYQKSERLKRREQPKKLHPPPAERIAQLLSLCETTDPRYFLKLCQEVTLEDTSTEYGHERFMVSSPGWGKANTKTRQQIVRAAKELLLSDTDEPESARSKPLNSILNGYMNAFFLLLDQERCWLEEQSSEWWTRWVWYVLRELRPHLMDEPDEPKHELLAILYSKSADTVRDVIDEFSTSNLSESRSVFISLLDLVRSTEDSTLDGILCSRLITSTVSDDRVLATADFLLTRSLTPVLPACIDIVSRDNQSTSDSAIISVSVALMQNAVRESWSRLLELFSRRPDLVQRILEEFSYRESSQFPKRENSGLAAMSWEQVGDVAAYLFVSFPPECDPRREDRTWSGPQDAAIHLRDRLVSWLGEQANLEAITALRKLEHRFGSKYSWLRRPRARAERKYSLSRWSPVQVRTIAEILSNQSKYLIRSGSDAIEGITAALEAYEHRLHHDSPNDLEDFWNRPKQALPTPKEEERVSEKICSVIRDYFRDYIVTADREVQIYRRKSPRSVDGASGSEVDVLCRVLARGSASGDEILIPIEVKLAHNQQAKAALKNQLADRYMSELGTDVALYVIVWMDALSVRARRRPVWKSIDEAKSELNHQASAIVSSNRASQIGIVVINASLPREVLVVKRPKRRPTSMQPRSKANKPTKKLPKKSP